MPQTGLPWTGLPRTAHRSPPASFDVSVFAAELVNIPACWYLHECTADRLHISRTAVTLSEIVIVFHAHGFGLKPFLTLMLHATWGQKMETAPSVAAAETWSGGLHTAAQVAEAPQAGPHQALTPSPGSSCPLPQTITSCSPHNFNQASLSAACQSAAMFCFVLLFSCTPCLKCRALVIIM